MDNVFVVVAISSNTNSFGLRNLVIFGPEGEAWSALSSQHNLPFRGQAFAYLPTYWECVRKMPKPPAEVYKLALKAAELANMEKA